MEGGLRIQTTAEADARCIADALDQRWHAYLGSDDLDAPAELVFYCPTAPSATSATTDARAVPAPQSTLL
jgi:hypothetical protein